MNDDTYGPIDFSLKMTYTFEMQSNIDAKIITLQLRIQ